MTFPTFIKRKFLAELRDRDDDGRPSPTDREILGLLDLWSDDQVKSLLAEMAEAGEITVRWTKDGREIVVGKVNPRAAVPVRPIPAMPTAARPDIVSNRRRETKTEEYSRGASGTARKASGVSVSAGTTRIEDRAPPQQEPEGIATLPAPSSGDRPKVVHSREPRQRPHRKQIAFDVDPVLYGRLASEAKALGIATGRYTRNLVEQAVNGTPKQVEADPEPTGKHRIRAAVINAWREEGGDFGAFVTSLIDIGLAVHLDSACEEARAA